MASPEWRALRTHTRTEELEELPAVRDRDDQVQLAHGQTGDVPGDAGEDGAGGDIAEVDDEGDDIESDRHRSTRSDLCEGQ